MSFQSMAWAVRQKLPCTQKMVLVMLADRHNDDTGRCDPSHDRLAMDCGLSRRTVIDHIETLANAGFLSISHRSIDGYKTSNQYKLNLNFNQLQDVQPLHIGSAATAHRSAATAHIDVQLSPFGSAATAHKPVIEPVIEPKEKRERITFGLPVDLLDDFLVVRKAKKAGELTNTAIKGIQREADKAGLTLIEAVTVCCELGWQGFNAGWYAERQAKASKANTPVESFKERDDRNARKRWEAMTGMVHPDNIPNHMEVFEADHLMLGVSQ